MKGILKNFCYLILSTFSIVLFASGQSAIDPLPSWNEGQVKSSIIAFVQKVTDSTSNNYIPPNDRIATFDNDGTLWAERPYVQELFAMRPG